MRRLTIAALAGVSLALSADFASAQRWGRRIHRILDPDHVIELGLVGGVNRNTVTGAGPVDARFRGSVGGFVSLPIAGVFRLRPELLVTGKQVGTEPAIVNDACPIEMLCLTANGFQETRSFTWLELPVLLEAKFRRGFGRWATPQLYGGPFVAIRLSCSIATPIEVTPVTTGSRFIRSCNSDGLGATYNNGDAGFVLGAGVSTGPVGMGVRWTRSLVPVAPFGSNVGQLAGAKHSTLALTVEVATRIR